MASLIDIEALRWRYGTSPAWLFDGLNLQVKPREFVAIVGGSGVGKSTLLRLVNGLISADQGNVTVRANHQSGRREHAMVFQDSRLLPWKRVDGNIAYALSGLGLDQSQIRHRIAEVLELTGLTEFARRWPHQLSGGQAQRVGIARALAVKPSILLMDEPFSAIDALTRAGLQNELLNIWQRTDAAVLFVTHDIDEAVMLADRIVVLGGSPADIVKDEPVGLARPRDRQTPEFHQRVADFAGALT